VLRPGLERERLADLVARVDGHAAIVVASTIEIAANESA
jgi:hypothetical protein